MRERPRLANFLRMPDKCAAAHLFLPLKSPLTQDITEYAPKVNMAFAVHLVKRLLAVLSFGRILTTSVKFRCERVDKGTVKFRYIHSGVSLYFWGSIN
jgi:hypothetical protein